MVENRDLEGNSGNLGLLSVLAEDSANLSKLLYLWLEWIISPRLYMML